MKLQSKFLILIFNYRFQSNALNYIQNSWKVDSIMHFNLSGKHLCALTTYQVLLCYDIMDWYAILVLETKKILVGIFHIHILFELLLIKATGSHCFPSFMLQL